MFKEIVICIIIIVLIFSLDIYTHNLTKDIVSKTTENFSGLVEKLYKNESENLTKEIQETKDDWITSHDQLAYYIEHDELEKVDTVMVNTISYVSTGDYSSSIMEVEKGKFILEHIQEKNEFNIQNIF